MVKNITTMESITNWIPKLKMWIKGLNKVYKLEVKFKATNYRTVSQAKSYAIKGGRKETKTKTDF